MEHLVHAALESTNSQYKDAAKKDILTALRAFGDLHAGTDVCEFPANGRRNSIVLDGTIPVKIRGSTYNIPIRLQLWDKHPYYAPICYVRPTPDMLVKQSTNVDPTGRVFMPYLAAWAYPSHSTQELLQMMVMTFQDNCPVFARPAAAPSYPAYPTYQPATPASGQLPYPIPHSASTSSLPYPAQPQTPYSSASVSTLSNTIKPEHIRASLLSAVEDRVAYAELQSVRKTRQDLVDGEQKLKSMLARLSDEERSLLATHDSLVDKRTELQRVLANAPRDDQMNIGRHPRLLHDHRRRADEIIAPTTPLHKQLMRAFVEDSALEDAIYNMGQALKRGTIMLDVYLKQVRDLSREQFLARATMHKCRQVAGLNAT